MLREAVAYPRAGEGAVRRLLVGGVLTFLAFLIVLPVIPLAGYVARSITTVANGGSNPPGFEDAQRLLLAGGKVIGVAIAYLLPAAIVGGIAIGLSGSSLLPDGVSGPVGLLGGVLAGVLGVGGLYAIPGAVSSFALNEDVSDAFVLRRLGLLALTTEYAIAFVATLALLVAGGVFLIAALAIAAVPAAQSAVPVSPIIAVVGFGAIGGIPAYYGLTAGTYTVGTGFRRAASAVVGG